MRKPADFAWRIIAIAPLPARVRFYGKTRLVGEIFPVAAAAIASRAAAAAPRAGSEGLMRRAIASGSTRFTLPSKFTAAVSVLFPEPFGPAMTVRVGASYAAVAGN